MEYTFQDTVFRVVSGDITTQEIDVVVNAAKPSLQGGGGVDGAIHRAGGAAILEECEEIRAQQGDCKTGQAVITTGGQLRAAKVIHTVGPVWRGGYESEYVLLESAYQESLKLAVSHGLRSIAFPSISTGAYGFPIDRAVYVALGTVTRFVQSARGSLDEVRFVLFSDSDFSLYCSSLREHMETKVG